LKVDEKIKIPEVTKKSPSPECAVDKSSTRGPIIAKTDFTLH